MFIALTGTIGAGKNTVADYLIQKGFSFASGSEIIAAEVKRRHLSVTRENMRSVANELRSKNANALIDLTISRVLGADKAAIGFLRTENEVKRLREAVPSARLIGIDAPTELRYERIKNRNEEKDQVTFEQFVQSEKMEMSANSPDVQNVGYCMAHADTIVQNDSTLENLFSSIDALIA